MKIETQTLLHRVIAFLRSNTITVPSAPMETIHAAERLSLDIRHHVERERPIAICRQCAESIGGASAGPDATWRHAQDGEACEASDCAPECPDCIGSGVSHAGEDCWTCGGRGRLLSDDSDDDVSICTCGSWPHETHGPRNVAHSDDCGLMNDDDDDDSWGPGMPTRGTAVARELARIARARADTYPDPEPWGLHGSWMTWRELLAEIERALAEAPDRRDELATVMVDDTAIPITGIELLGPSHDDTDGTWRLMITTDSNTSADGFDRAKQIDRSNLTTGG